MSWVNPKWIEAAIEEAKQGLDEGGLPIGAVICEWYFNKQIPTASPKDTNRKTRKPKFIYICGSKNGSSSSAVNTGEVWGDVSRAQKALSMSY